MQQLCPNCFQELTNITNKNIITRKYKFNCQCENCFYLSDAISIFNINDQCPICLDLTNDKCLFPTCSHWICQDCYKMYDKDKCPICLKKLNGFQIRLI